jgi:hypothetical protein
MRDDDRHELIESQRIALDEGFVFEDGGDDDRGRNP